MSVFDKDTFLNTSVTGATDSTYTPIPEGEYKAFIDELGLDKYNDAERGEVPVLILTYALIEVDHLKEELGIAKPTVQDRLFLDVENGALAFGPNKNVKLGMVREATGQNDAKKAWNMNLLRGAGPVVLKVTHRYNKAGEGPFSNVARIAKAA